MPIDNNEKELILRAIKTNNLKIKNFESWKNFSKNLDCPNALVLDIQDKASLQQLVKTVYEINQKKNSADRILLRAAAGSDKGEYNQSYSFTPGADADVIVRLTGDEFKKITSVNGQPKVVSVGASMQIGTVDKELYEKHNLSLPTASLIPYVTVAGLSANAGHGTGRHQPGFAGLIRAMTLCLPDGNIVRIDKNHKDFKTIRAAHLGLFGIVLDIELECTEAKKMQCVTEARSIPDFLDEVKNGVFFNDPYVSVMYVPTYHKDELTNRDYKNVIVYRWRPVNKSVNDVNSHPVFSHAGQELEIKLEEGLHVVDLLREFPDIIPYYMRYLVSRASIGTKDQISVGPWYTMHYQTAFPWDIDDADYLFKTGRDNKEISTALETIVQSLTECRKNNQYPIVDAVYMRMFKGTNGGLSTSPHGHGEHVCGLDMVSSTGIPGYEVFKDKMQDYFIDGPLKSKPHWGKYVPADVDYAKVYGENFTQFNQTLKNWYEEHGLKLENSMLLNSFFCQVLQLPYVPAQQTDLSKRMVFTTVIAVALIATQLCALIEGEDIHAVNLRKRLRAIAAKNTFDHGCFSFFKAACCGKRPEVEKEEVKVSFEVL